MKSGKEIREKISRLRADDRLKQPAADVEVNAPLALIQVDIEAQIRALEWVLE